MFKRNDIVTYNNRTDYMCRYAVTNENMKSAKVTRISKESGIMEIRILDHVYRDEIGNVYTVDSRFFLLKSNIDKFLLT